jgi:hypothetical protein
VGIKEGEEVHAKGICNLFNKIIGENFPNIKNISNVKGIPFRLTTDFSVKTS